MNTHILQVEVKRFPIQKTKSKIAQALLTVTCLTLLISGSVLLFHCNKTTVTGIANATVIMSSNNTFNSCFEVGPMIIFDVFSIINIILVCFLSLISIRKIFSFKVLTSSVSTLRVLKQDRKYKSTSRSFNIKERWKVIIWITTLISITNTVLFWSTFKNCTSCVGFYILLAVTLILLIISIVSMLIFHNRKMQIKKIMNFPQSLAVFIKTFEEETANNQEENQDQLEIESQGESDLEDHSIDGGGFIGGFAHYQNQNKHHRNNQPRIILNANYRPQSLIFISRERRETEESQETTTTDAGSPTSDMNIL